MLQQEIPSLQHGLSNPQLLPLPPSSNIRVLSTSDPQNIRLALNCIVDHVRKLEDGDYLAMGLDCEWSVEGYRKVGKVKLLQLAISTKLGNDPNVTGKILIS